ncbi:MAG: hypothetical protein J5979_05105 [Lachnospiraceae bacterium]|nr:hypothetical protein [Lachnospiraceae bacterium]
MNRPYTICHILSALDGKIIGAFTLTVVSVFGNLSAEVDAASKVMLIRGEGHGT